MNIREAEVLTGLERANLRFYEVEGLISPERESNGYRNYTDGDIQILKRIKLLRMLEVPIDEIRQIQSNEVQMRTVLERSIRRAEDKKRELNSAQQICRKMNEDQVTWDTLQADRYLNQFGKVDMEERSREFSVQDYPVYEPHNIRRYVARLVDMQLYGLMIYALYYLVLSPGIHLKAPNSWVVNLFAFVLMFLLEPLCLRVFGTTPGKWILGIRVRHLVGRKLTMEEARRRTWNVMLWGFGLNIPIFSLIRLVKSAFDNSEGKALPWDNGGEYELDVVELAGVKQKVLRIGGCLLAFCLLAGGQVYLQLDAQYPIHRGKLTKAELAENINTYLDEVGIYSKWNLDDEMNWKEEETLGNVIIVGDSVDFKPKLQIVETDGYVTQLSFKQTITEDGVFSGHDRLIQVLMMSFGGAKPEVNFLNSNLKDMLNLISENSNGKFSETIAGIDIAYELINYSYEYFEGYGYVGRDGKENKLTVTFSMTLTE